MIELKTAVGDVTQILNAIEQGDTNAAGRLLPMVYEELRKLAAAKMANEMPGQTLQPTALVHEAWLRLVGGDDQIRFNGRAHFFGAAAEAMRRILIESARRKRAVRHGGEHRRVDVEKVEIASDAPNEELLALSEALDKLEAHDKSKADLVKLRYFVGLNLEETADILGVSLATAKRHWNYARAWIHAEMKLSG